MMSTSQVCQPPTKIITNSCLTLPRLPQRARAPARHRVVCSAEYPYAQPNSKGSPVSGPDEDREVAHTAFLHAFQTAQPERARIPGLQEFASALLARARIPSQQYTDPLKHLFQEFDVNGDGCLEAHEVGEALRSRDIKITDEQVQMFIDVLDLSGSPDGQVHESEFRDLILHMAAADLHSRRVMHDSDEEGEWVRCILESDDEIQMRLKSWVDHIMLRRYK